MNKKEKIKEKMMGIELGALASMIAYIPMLILTGAILNLILFEILKKPSNTNIDDYLSIYFFWVPTLILGLLGGFLVTFLPPNRSGEKRIPLRSSLAGIVAAIIVSFWMNWTIFNGWIESERTYVISNPVNNTATVEAIPLLSSQYQELVSVNGNIDSFDVNAEGHLLAYSVDKLIFIRNLETNSEQGNPLFGHTNKVSDVAISPDGRWLVSGSFDQQVIIWSLETYQPVYELAGHKADQLYVAISPDNRTVASGDNQGTVILWDIATGQELERFHTDSAKLLCLEFSPDGKLLAVCTDYPDGVYLWSMVSHQDAGKLFLNNEWNGTVHGMDFSPNGQLAAGAALFGPLLWDLSKQFSTWTFQDILTGNNVDFSPDGKNIVSTSYGDIYLWKVASKKPIGKLGNSNFSKAEAAFIENDKILALYWDKPSADRYAVITKIGIWSYSNR
jgi:WD40 repeat protein